MRRALDQRDGLRLRGGLPEHQFEAEGADHQSGDHAPASAGAGKLGLMLQLDLQGRAVLPTLLKHPVGHDFGLDDPATAVVIQVSAARHATMSGEAMKRLTR